MKRATCTLVMLSLRPKPRPSWPWSRSLSTAFPGRIAHASPAPPRSISPCRSASTSSFFDSHPPRSDSHSPPKPRPPRHPLVIALDDSLSTSSVRRISHAYHKLRDARLAETEHEVVAMSQNRLLRTSHVAFNSARSPEAAVAAADLVELVLADATTLWGFQFGDDEARVFLRAQERRATRDEPTQPLLRCTLRKIQALNGYTGGAAFGRSMHWLDLFEGRLVDRDAKGATLAWRYMRRLVEGNISTTERDAYVRCLFRARASAKVLRELRAPARGVGGEEERVGLFLSWDKERSASLGMLLDGLHQAGHAHDHVLEELSSELQQRLLDPDHKAPMAAYHSLLCHAACKRDGSPAQALELVSTLRHRGGFITTDQTFVLLLRLHEQEMQGLAQPGGTEEDVATLFRAIEDATGIKAGRKEFAIGIETLLGCPPRPIASDEPSQDADDEARWASRPLPTPGQVVEAQLLLARFRETGFTMDSTLAQPLIRAYCTSFLPQLSQALALLEELLSNVGRKRGGWLFSLAGWTEDKRRRSREAFEAWKVDKSVPVLILDGCVRARELGTARHVLKQLRDAGGTVERLPAEYRARLVEDLFDVCQSFDEAYDVYADMRDLYEDGGRGAGGFTRQGWYRLVFRFTKLRFGPGVEGLQPAPIEYFVSLLRDVTLAGHSPDVKMFTSLLDSYGKAASRLSLFSPRDRREASMRREGMDVMRATVLALHELMRSLVDLQPDMPLMTALMDAYNRVGLPWQVKEIWNRLLLSRARMQASTVAVFLDTCGRNAMLRDARRAWALVGGWEREAVEEAAEQQGDEAKVTSTSTRDEERDDTTLPPKLRNLNVWLAWLECLARCGRLEEAIEEVLPFLASSSSTSVAQPPPPMLHSLRLSDPPEQAMELLVRFAARYAERGDEKPMKRLAGYVGRERPELAHRLSAGGGARPAEDGRRR